ncbi:MAG: CsgG/HfaB family protein [Candidatus Competibacteraceae bacterium]
MTQGATSILIKALQDAGRGSWFTVVERSRLNNLLKERQIVKEMRKRYGETEQVLPPMLFAGLILEGGIISFDTNTKTGGLGARYLGIGASTEYRQDTVTVYLRATSTQSGEILKSVMARKTIASFGVSASVFKFVSFKELLEVEAGYTSNEPGQEAIKQAIEKAVYALIAEGAQSGLWAFRNEQLGQQVIERYRAEKYQQPDPRAQASTPKPQIPEAKPHLTQDSGDSDVVQCDDGPITRSSKHSTALVTSTSTPSGPHSEVTSL